jgi:hypothetical protein
MDGGSREPLARLPARSQIQPGPRTETLLTGARHHKYLQINIFVTVSKTVIRR